MIGLPKKFAAQ